uniref:Uncharacterized protein n=1 Tax=Oryza glumipatula TaxID=40148 RepID=A0A0D9Z872_9ORYZ
MPQAQQSGSRQGSRPCCPWVAGSQQIGPGGSASERARQILGQRGRPTPKADSVPMAHAARQREKTESELERDSVTASEAHPMSLEGKHRVEERGDEIDKRQAKKARKTSADLLLLDRIGYQD